MSKSSFNWEKQPDEIKRKGIDFRNDLISGDGLASATYVIKSGDTIVTDQMIVSGTGKITNENPNTIPSVNDTASIQVASGDSGFPYDLTILATTLSGDKLEGDIHIHVLNT